jgi:hypothetical protein
MQPTAMTKRTGTHHEAVQAVRQNALDCDEEVLKGVSQPKSKAPCRLDSFTVGEPKRSQPGWRCASSSRSASEPTSGEAQPLFDPCPLEPDSRFR